MTSRTSISATKKPSMTASSEWIATGFATASSTAPGRPEVSREIFERGNAVATLLYDPERDTVVMVEQFRLPAYLAGRSAWCLETPAGIVKPGEELADVARREALEETGCEIIGEIRQIGRVHGQHRRQHGDRHGVLWGGRFADG